MGDRLPPNPTRRYGAVVFSRVVDRDEAGVLIRDFGFRCHADPGGPRVEVVADSAAFAAWKRSTGGQ